MTEDFIQLQEELNQIRREFDVFLRHDHLISGGEPLRLKDLPYYGLQQVSITLPGTSAAVQGNFDTFFIAEYDLEIVAVSESHRVAATSATLDIEKLTTGGISGSGVSTLSTTFDLTSAAETPVRVLGSTIVANRTLKRGDRLSLLRNLSVVNFAHMTVSVWFLPLYKLSK